MIHSRLEDNMITIATDKLHNNAFKILKMDLKLLVPLTFIDQ